MKQILLSLSLAVALASCQTLDNKVAVINSSVKAYCDFITAASGIAETIGNKKVYAQINAATTTYCQPDTVITDIPTALLALAKVYKAVNDAGINPTISVAAN
jgi:hypothetical protein